MSKRDRRRKRRKQCVRDDTPPISGRQPIQRIRDIKWIPKKFKEELIRANIRHLTELQERLRSMEGSRWMRLTALRVLQKEERAAFFAAAEKSGCVLHDTIPPPPAAIDEVAA